MVQRQCGAVGHVVLRHEPARGGQPRARASQGDDCHWHRCRFVRRGGVHRRHSERRILRPLVQGRGSCRCMRRTQCRGLHRDAEKGFLQGLRYHSGFRTPIHDLDEPENEWPIARTTYPRWFFDATPSDWKGDEYRNDFLRLSATPPIAERQVDYSAEIPLELRTGIPPCFLPVKPPAVLEIWKTGISFISEPVKEDMVFAGYGKAKLWVSST